MGIKRVFHVVDDLGHVRFSEEMFSMVIIACELIMFIGEHWFILLTVNAGILALLKVSPIYF